MNRKIIKVAFIVAIAMVSGINVFNSQKSEPLSDIALANVEALADGELLPGEYDILEEKTVFAVDDVPYKETKIVKCEPGGRYACRECRYWRQKFNGVWSDWFYA